MLLGFGFLMTLGGSHLSETAKTAPAFYVVLISPAFYVVLISP
jgi:hypothetical protein